MVIALRKGEIVEKSEKIDTIHGKAMWYITNDSMMIETESEGIIFERLHSQMASIVCIDKKKIKIEWVEGREIFDFEFKIKNANEHVNDIMKNHDYADNFPDLVGVNDVQLSEKDVKDVISKRIDMAKSKIKKLETQLKEANNKVNTSKNESDEDILESVNEAKDFQNFLDLWHNYLKNINNYIVNRSKKIPKHIPNNWCWNDCYFDEKYQCFLTFNKVFNSDPYSNDESVKKFKSENTIPNLWVIPVQSMTLLNGYPVTIKDESHTKEPQFYIPTFTDEMLTDKIISKHVGVPVEITDNDDESQTPPTVIYHVNPTSNVILTNGERYHFTRKEVIFMIERKRISQTDIDLMP